MVEEKRMFSKRSRLLVAALAVLCMMSTVPLAAEEVLSGTVQQANAPAGTLTLRFVDGKTVTLTAPVSLLNDLQPGDAVEVRTSGQLVTGLNMKGAPPQLMQPSGVSQRPGFGGLVVSPRS
jgi:nitrous oxidase accessory protein NosD